MRAAGTAVAVADGQRFIPIRWACMFLGFDDLMWKGYDAVWAKGVPAVLVTPDQEVTFQTAHQILSTPFVGVVILHPQWFLFF